MTNLPSNIQKIINNYNKTKGHEPCSDDFDCSYYERLTDIAEKEHHLQRINDSKSKRYFEKNLEKDLEQ